MSSSLSLLLHSSKVSMYHVQLGYGSFSPGNIFHLQTQYSWYGSVLVVCMIRIQQSSQSMQLNSVFEFSFNLEDYFKSKLNCWHCWKTYRSIFQANLKAIQRNLAFLHPSPYLEWDPGGGQAVHEPNDRNHQHPIRVFSVLRINPHFVSKFQLFFPNRGECMSGLWECSRLPYTQTHLRAKAIMYMYWLITKRHDANKHNKFLWHRKKTLVQRQGRWCFRSHVLSYIYGTVQCSMLQFSPVQIVSSRSLHAVIYYVRDIRISER